MVARTNLRLPLGPCFALLALTPTAASQAFTIEQAGHVIRRMEYGASVGDLVTVLGPDTTNYINYALGQLAPGVEAGESKDLIGRYTSFPTVLTGGEPDLNIAATSGQPVGVSVNELSEINIALALKSPNQLREKMTQLWQKHFSTNYWKLRGVLIDDHSLSDMDAEALAAHFEWQQNAGFRANALGTFRDLLEVSSKGLAMSIYLDTVDNLNQGMNPQPNQNYGRELLELHTLGVDGWKLDAGVWVKGPTYSFQDIKAMSRVFSGYELEDMDTGPGFDFQLSFDSNLHFLENPPTLQQYPVFATNSLTGAVGALQLQESLTAYDEVDQALDYLAAHPHTALNIISIIWEYLIGGEAPDPTNATFQLAVAQWGTQGNINGVLTVLLSSPEFLTAPDRFWNQARLPMEILGQAVDCYGGSLFDSTLSNLDDNKDRLVVLRQLMSEYMGRNLFQYPAPDGFPFESQKQLTPLRVVGANRLRQKLYANAVFSPAPPYALYNTTTDAVLYDPIGLLVALAIDPVNPVSLADGLSLVLFTESHDPIDEAYLTDFFERDLSGAKTIPLASDTLPNIVDRITRGFAYGASLSLNNLK